MQRERKAIKEVEPSSHLWRPTRVVMVILRSSAQGGFEPRGISIEVRLEEPWTLIEVLHKTFYSKLLGCCF